MTRHRVPERLALATTLSSGTVLVAAITWLLTRSDLERASPADAAGLLVAVAFLCLAGLLLRRSTAGAWFAVAAAAIVATREPASLQAQLRLAGPEATWLAASSISAATATAATIVAALYADRPDRRLHPAVGPLAWGLVGWLAGAAVLWVALASAGFDERDRIPGSVVLFFPIRQWGFVVLALTAVGVVGDVLPAARRARARAAADPDPTGRSGWPVIFIDELSGRADARRSAAETERRRLAGDLHAATLPALRAALADLEAGRPAELVATRLRDIATELETVMRDRRDPVLESLGLVAALEVLAEQTEERSGIEVGLAVLDGHSALRPPATVEAVAHRVAMLAVDNAIRHGSPRRVDLQVVTGRTAVELDVADDGRGIADDDEARALRDGRHGLAEIRRLAAEIDGTAEVGREADGGTVVRFRWSARR